jgi:uncharacterized spore protein YtfJ
MTTMETAVPDEAVMDLLRKVADNATVRSVFGEPVTVGDVTVIPAAKVSGGAGGGNGTDPRKSEAQGTGGGLGIMARPVGAYVIRQGRVSWRPALDLNRVILGGQIVAVVAILTVRAIATRRRKVR